MRLRRTHANQVEQSAEGTFVENRISIADAFPIELQGNTWIQPNVNRILERKSKETKYSDNLSGARLFVSFYTPLQDDKYGNKY